MARFTMQIRGGVGARLLRRSAFIGVIIVVVSGLAVAAGSAATGQTGGLDTRFQRIDLKNIGRLPDGSFVPASLSNKQVTAMLEFGGAPVARYQADALKHGKKLSNAEKAAIRGQLRSAQDAARPAIQGAGAAVIGELQDAYNGVLVRVAEKDLSKLGSISGVTGVHVVRAYRPSNINGVPYIGGPEVWGGVPGNTGAGIKIAVIDTGIDYYHANFGGSGNPADFANADGTTLADNQADHSFPNAKVVGGTDLVGDDYNADPTDASFQPVPHPDPDPLDCEGHGSHTAGTAAGFGVTAAGDTFHGPYNAGTDSNPANFKIGPGVAPGALIYAYRAFGCQGSSDIVAEAVNQAVKDGVNVISMSLGSDLGDQSDPTAVASENAAAAGIVVVAAAGNAGPNAYVNGSPAAANSVISAAAIDGSTPTLPAANLTFGSTTIPAINANVAPLPPGPHPIKVLRNPDGSVSLGCDPSQYQGVAGAVVVTVRGTCARVARAIFAEQAGAVAAVMVNTSTTFPPLEGPITENPDNGVPFKVTIPFLGVRGVLGPDPLADGDALVVADGQNVTFAPITVTNPAFQRQASFSSGGPRNFDSAPKPDVSAPGVSVISTGKGTGTEAAFMSGTSMATPMTSGSAALVLAAHPEWTDIATTSDRVKAALMNTADPTAATIIGYNQRVAGSGVVQVQMAVQVNAFATTSDHLESLAFGYVPAAGAVNETKSFTITNQTDSAVSYDLSSSDPHVSVPGSLTVPAGASASVDATLSLSASDVAGLPPAEASNFGALAGTIRGAVTATPSSAGAGLFPLRVPFFTAARGLSNVTAGTPAGFAPGKGGGSTFSSSVAVRNGGIHAGNADLYSWGITDPNDTDSAPMDVRDVGLQVLPGSALGGADSDRSLVFAINTWGRAANQSVNEYDVAVDTNGDNKADFVVVGVDLGLVTAGSVNGQFASFTIDVNSGALVDAFVADAPMNGSTVELPALASEVGVTGGKKNGVTYAVAAFSLVPGGLVDTTSSATFDPFDPAVSSGDFLSLDPGASGTLPLTIDRGLQQKSKVLGWLAVTLDDANGADQAAEIPGPSNLGH